MVLSLRKLELLLKKEEAGNTCLLVARTVDMGFGKTLLLKGTPLSVGWVGRRAYIAGMGTWGKALGVKNSSKKALEISSVCVYGLVKSLGQKKMLF